MIQKIPNNNIHIRIGLIFRLSDKSRYRPIVTRFVAFYSHKHMTFKESVYNNRINLCLIYCIWKKGCGFLHI